MTNDVVTAVEADVKTAVADAAPVVAKVEAAAKADLAALEARVKVLESTVVTKAEGFYAKAVAWVKSHYVAVVALLATPVGSSYRLLIWSKSDHFVVLVALVTFTGTVDSSLLPAGPAGPQGGPGPAGPDGAGRSGRAPRPERLYGLRKRSGSKFTC
jgi:hypothetical protein